MQVKTKFERNSSLEYYHMWENRRQKFKGTNKKPDFEVLVSTIKMSQVLRIVSCLCNKAVL